MGNSSSNLEGKCENWPLVEAGSLILCNSYKEEENKLCRWDCRYRGGGNKIVRLDGSHSINEMRGEGKKHK